MNNLAWNRFSKMILAAVFVFCHLPALFASELKTEETDFSSWYGYLYIGDNFPDSSTGKLKTVNYKGGGPLEWGIGIGKYINNEFSIEGTFEYWGERYERQDSPAVAGTDNNVIQAGGLGLSVSGVYNYKQKDFHAYLGAGAGLFLTGILVTEPGSGLLTTEGAPSDKLLPGYHLITGVSFPVSGNHKIGLEIKHRILEADFGQYTNGEADLGGTFYLLMYRHSRM